MIIVCTMKLEIIIIGFCTTSISATPVAVKLIKRADGEDKVVLPNERNILECAHENVIRIIKVSGGLKSVQVITFESNN